MIQSIIVAFSMYSKIPMPRIEWNKKNMRYALCFFPLVGVVIGMVEYGGFLFCQKMHMGTLFTACCQTLLPVFITGGIHLDGYLDTVDALSSYGDREKKLEILKDSHAGAFAILYGIVYFVTSIGIWSEIKKEALPFICIGYLCSRTLSGFSVATFPLAKKTGLAATFQDQAHKRNVKLVMLSLFLIESVLLLLLDWKRGGLVIISCLVCFFLHYYICKCKFGGITGDLAGFFLQVCELVIVASMLVG